MISFWRTSLAAKIALPALLIVSIVFFGAFAYSQFFYREHIRSIIAANADFDIRYLSERLKAVRSKTEASVRYISADLAYTPLTPMLADTLFRSMLNSNKDIYGGTISLLTDDPIKEFAPYYWQLESGLQQTTLIKDGYPYQEAPWFTEPLKRGDGYWSAPYFSTHGDTDADNIFMITFSMPVHTMLNDLPALVVVAADISLEWLEKQLASLLPYAGSYSFLLGAENQYIIPPPKEIILDKDAEKILFSSVITGKAGYLPQEKGYILYRPIDNNMSVALFIPNVAVFSQLEVLEKRLFVFGVLCLLLCTGGIAFIIVLSLRPLHGLSAAAAQIANGMLEIDLPAVKSVDEIGQLISSFTQMRVALKEYIATLTVTTATKERLESELAVARIIQAGFLPHTFPPFPLQKNLDIHAALRPAKEVGGDLYDFFMPSEHELFFVIGDVSGKGIPAALFMAVTRTLLKGKSPFRPSLHDLISDVNIDLNDQNEQCMFVTMLAGLLNLHNGNLTLINAGHDAPLLYTKNNKLVSLKAEINPPLGISLPDFFTVQHYKLEQGETLFMYTDGVPEAQNAAGNFFGYANIENILAKYSQHSSKDIIEQMFAALDQHTGSVEQSDDITILTVKLVA